MISLKKLFFVASVAVLSACSAGSADKNVAEVEGVSITRSVIKDAPESKCVAKIAVDGMSCAEMCGGSIAGCLKKMDGIKSADISFDPEKDPDFATIEFDEKIVTEKEMIAAIEKLNDGQYKVKSIEIVVSEVSYQKIEKEEKKDEKAAAKVTAFNTINIAIPSIFEILTRVIQ